MRLLASSGFPACRSAVLAGLRVVPCVIAFAASMLAAPAHAEMIGGNPGPAYNFVCPNSDGKPPLDCYFDAVAHLYTMCKHVKSIEILEFGYDKSTEGTNAAKSESCLVKMKLNMTRPYQAALKAAAHFKAPKAVDGLRRLNELWLKALADLAWKPGESDGDYKARTMKPYESFSSGIVEVQTAVQLAEAEAKEKAAAKGKGKAPAKPAKTPAKRADTASTKTTAAPAKKAATHAKEAATPAKEAAAPAKEAAAPAKTATAPAASTASN